MSIEALNWALAHMQGPTMPSSTRFTLMILANRADPEGNCFPSVRYIMARTGLSERTTRIACRDLVDRGLMKVEEQQRVDGGRTSNRYMLGLDIPPPAATAGPPPAAKDRAPPAATAGHETKDRDRTPAKAGETAAKPRRPIKTTWPAGFGISPRVAEWASSKGYITTYLLTCLEAFESNVKAKGLRYVDWDEAFMTWVRREPVFSRQAPPKAAVAPPDQRCAWTNRGTEPRCQITEGTLRANDHAYLCQEHMAIVRKRSTATA